MLYEIWETSSRNLIAGFPTEDVVLDFDGQGALVGIDVDHASHLLDLTKLETVSVPLPSTESTS